MSLSILNNIAALYAENDLNSTQSNLQTTLQQLSSGSRINSGADDPAGLAVSDGLGANEAALTQSSQNATDGIGLLQTADGALSQVTGLLDQAVTLATESANGTLTAGQVSSANQEYQNILSQIGNIGATTNFNSSNVFSASATNIVVTDGTSAGLNTYADTVGTLTTASVGTTAAAAPTTAAAASVSTAPVAAVANAAGVYTLTANAASDTLNGTLSFTVGSSTTATNVSIAANSTLTQVAQDLTTAGLNSTVSNNVITITGPTSGANAAANTVNFTSNLSDTPATTAVSGSAVGTTAVAGTASTGSLSIASAASGDTFAGTIILTQGGTSHTVTIAAGSLLGSASSAGTVQNQIVTQLGGTPFSLASVSGTATNPTFNFSGLNNTTAITTTGTFADTTNATSGTVTDNAGVAGTANVQGTFVLGALGSANDTFGSGVANTLDINGTSLSVAGLTATQAKTLINANSTLNTAGITASVNGSGTVLTISGNANGSALTVLGNGGGALALTDQAPNNTPITSAGITTAPVGTVAVGGKSTITLGSSGDTLSGTLTEIVNTGASAKTATLAVAAGTTGQQLANEINASSSFATAGLTAVYNSSNSTVVLTGPTGAGNTIASTGTSLTDTSSALPQAGANFTTAAVSTLTASTASTILTTVTAAVADVAYQRGTIGADINELTSASGVASSEEVNLTSAQDSISATDYGAAASNLSKYQILSQTGISALAQANSVQQEVLKLLQ
ncbi:MAG: flagellin [Acidobacteriaceae bacterium]|jgi:flagellin